MKYIEGEYYIVKQGSRGNAGTLKTGDLFKVDALESVNGEGNIDITICNRTGTNNFFSTNLERTIVKACSILKIFYMK